eukprot:TRINITY_DN11997_c0_g1_i1.p1 TRINITY_DN11997_c0_g1~~TRINITY_DN11997_c0_g1_i1.p1  ORF type:complete len:873 (-),score=229.18 TRINITY_DN11997_c0_g1_i1:357-2975(-)
MGELWRSQEMQLVRLYIQIEAAHDTINELGKLGVIQFKDMNSQVNAFQRNFATEIKRADEMERKLRFFESQILKANNDARDEGKALIPIDEAREEQETKVHFDELDAKFDELEKQIQEMNAHQEALNTNHNQLIELKVVLEKDEGFFAEAGQHHETHDNEEEAKVGLISERAKELQSGLGFVSGVIDYNTFHLFERVLYRVTRGNLFMKFSEIEKEIKDPRTGVKSKKVVFIVFFSGQQLESRIRKICESFSAHLYPCPSTPTERKDLLEKVKSRLDDLEMVLTRGWERRSQILGEIGVHLKSWQSFVRKEKGIFATMNMFNYDHGRKCLIAEGWCVTSAVDSIQFALRAARQTSGALVPSIMETVVTSETPPTYFKTNNLTAPFQNIVDSYGVARYREINPAVFTVVTFPWQFGLMYGDVGHGILLLLFSLFLIYKEKDWEGKKINEMFSITYYGRYCLLLMSLFAIYQGALYNEMFALPMDFGSNWQLEHGPQFSNSTFTRNDTQFTYYFGVDPIWKGATNELLYYNSLKMKMSIVIGVLQMSLGLILHMLNGIHFRKWWDVYFEFIPRFVFLHSIFGYLCFLIFYKWNRNYIGQDIYNKEHGIVNATGQYCGTGNAPVLLNELIFMFLPRDNDTNPVYDGQKTVQMILVVLAGLSVPIMTFVKPCLLRYENNQKKKRTAYGIVGGNDNVVHHIDSEEPEEPKEKQESQGNSSGSHGGGSGGHGHGEEFDFGEIMVHQVLETIEFVLGSVSHTASYLRLWALSLAHSELATVFWDKVFMNLDPMPYLGLHEGFKYGFAFNALMFFIVFAVWLAATLLVLLFMESLSAFLHALRLHWVEFQSKFYKGDGYAFRPLSWATLESEEQEVVPQE